MKQKKLNEGLFDVADRFVAAFFKGLENNTANQVIRAAERAKLPPEAIKLMQDIENRKIQLKKALEKSRK
jgi:hypothetical protein